MAQIKLIGVDLDGTVLNAEKKITVENIETFRRCRESGIYVVPVTGRPVSGLYEEYRRDIACRYSIHTNGAVVIDAENNREIITHTMSAKTATEVADILDRFDNYYGIFHGGYGYLENGDYLAELKHYENTPMYEYLIRSRRSVENKRNFLYTLDHCDNIYAIARNGRTRSAILDALKDVEGIFYTCSAERDVEIGGMCSKGSTLMELADKLGIRRDEVMAIGDSGNDLKMLEAAGFSVAMKNASDEIKAAADYVTRSCEKSGVSHAIRKFVFGEGKI